LRINPSDSWFRRRVFNPQEGESNNLRKVFELAVKTVQLGPKKLLRNALINFCMTRDGENLSWQRRAFSPEPWRNIMPEKHNSAVGLFSNHQDAESAVKELQQSGYDMKKLSVVGKDYHTEENVIGYYNTGDRMATWGKFGLFWGWIWGLLFGSAFLLIPGIGPVMVGGPLVSWILGALETAVVTGGLTALGGALVSIGIPKDSVIRYETALKADKFILIVHGSTQEVEKAKDILIQNKAEEANVH